MAAPHGDENMEDVMDDDEELQMALLASLAEVRTHPVSQAMLPILGCSWQRAGANAVLRAPCPLTE